mmetsp:Transcript_22644/g.29389  ORF Transcript_22644/g.29389 Transcript_22644/m.29389 type:complete len:371 (+) Transcript_22644:225-1337(+)
MPFWKSLFNFGGPGWFADVFELEIELDKNAEIDDPGDPFILPWNTWTGKCVLFETTDTITGKLKVSAPPNRKVWHSVITVRLEEYLVGPESYGASESCALEVEVKEPGYLQGETEIPFELKLEDIEGATWNEWYTGKLLSLRHLLVVTIERPWYTFDVSRQLVVGLQKIDPAPQVSQGESVDGVLPHVIQVLDCGGVCNMDYHIDSYNLGSHLKGTIQLSSLTNPVVSLRILLLKVEFADGDVFESILLEHTVIKNPNPTPPEDSEEEEAEPMNLADDETVVKTQEGAEVWMGPVSEDIELAVDIDLKAVATMAPSFISMTQVPPETEEDLCAVRYFLRLVVYTPPKFSWNTNEIFIHRSVSDVKFDLDV